MALHLNDLGTLIEKAREFTSLEAELDEHHHDLISLFCTESKEQLHDGRLYYVDAFQALESSAHESPRDFLARCLRLGVLEHSEDS